METYCRKTIDGITVRFQTGEVVPEGLVVSVGGDTPEGGWRLTVAPIKMDNGKVLEGFHIQTF